MIKRLLSLLLTLVGCCSLFANGLPKLSTDKNEVWYLIQFAEGHFVFDGKADNADLKNEEATGTDEQLWKFTGNEDDGFTITNKKGYSLFVTETTKNGYVKVAKQPTKHALFDLVPTGNIQHKAAFEILPKENHNVGLNMVGGLYWRNGKVGLWDKNDVNNCVSFVEEKAFEQVGKIAIIPYPQSLEITKNGGLKLKDLKTICCPDAAMAQHLEAFAAQLKQTSGISLKVTDEVKKPKNTIQMTFNTKLPKEGYSLKVKNNSILIEASETAGFFYALQTLKQMLPAAFFGQEEEKELDWTVPYVSIVDQPQLGHRGFMLDIARHFFDKKEVMRILDVMALYKMNIFHWHLTDDQGWRIEIPEYPKLTEVGSIRKGSFTNPGENGQKFWDDTEYGRGMWYSQKDLKEVVAYAKARNIDIIPEVDFPGHMVAAVTAYPELSCDPSKHYEVRLDAGVSKDVLNIGNDKVIDFLKCIMDNLAQIFPYQYIHFGGDECPTDQWKNNADCLKRIKDNKLKGVEELQSWLIEELGTYVKEKYNRDIMVWDELVAHWNTHNKIKPVVMCWHNNNDAAANKGLKTITCPHDFTYLDMMQIEESKALLDEPYRGGWNDGKVTTLQKTYSLNPNYKTKGREDFCLGVQANMWTETTNDCEELEYQIFPRVMATAETGWLPYQKKNWTSFYKRLQSHDEIWEGLGIAYAKHFIEPTSLSEKDAALKEASQILSESIRGGVGYPDIKTYDALKAALKSAQGRRVKDNEVQDLQKAIANYKKAPVLQPQPGKFYHIISACTYYKQQFAGASLYECDGGLRIHYTPQNEPEELWEFVATGDGFRLKNVGTQLYVTLPKMGAPVAMGNEGTLLRMDKATRANRQYDYVPGAVILSAVEGYSAKSTGKVMRLAAELSGTVHVADDVTLSYPGTWIIVEVDDMKAQLAGLSKKSERILRNTPCVQNGLPTSKGAKFLTEEVVEPVKQALNHAVDKETYLTFMERYYEFQAMPKTCLLNNISEDFYYYIKNDYSGTPNCYAAANVTENNLAGLPLNPNEDRFYWRIKKFSDGTIAIINKANDQYTHVFSNMMDTKMQMGNADEGKNHWQLEEVTTDQNETGISIVYPKGNNAWYTYATENIHNVVLRPKTYGASIWKFVKTDKRVEK